MNNVVVGHRALENEGCEQSGNNEGVSVTSRLGNRNLSSIFNFGFRSRVDRTRRTPRLQY